MTSEVATATSTALRRAIVPLALGVSIAVLPAPAGLTPNAWHFFALFVTVIAALVTEPIPGPVIGLLGRRWRRCSAWWRPSPPPRSAAGTVGALAPLPLFAKVVGIVLAFFVALYMLASLTAHTTALLPAFLAVVAASPDLPLRPLSLLLCYTLGLMGVLTPYATGSAPIYYSSGYITRREFWRLGAIFGAVYLAVLLGLGLPYLMVLTR